MNNTSLRQSELGIYTDVHSYLKQYPKFSRLVRFKEPQRVREEGWEPEFTLGLPNTHSKANFNFYSENLSLQRSKTKLADLVLCNEFNLFSTFTFAKDRQDINRCKQKMSKHFSNLVTRHGKFDYIIVPEFHKDGKSIHFHALTNRYPITLIPSGIRKKHKTIYNIKEYRSGFSTATIIEHQDKVANYIKKYITKEMPHFAGKKRYWVSQGLNRPVKIYNPQIQTSDMAKFTTIYHNNLLEVLHSDVVISKY